MKATDQRASYHHGDLRRALIAAAVEMVEQVGPEAFTLREVARRIGVSHAAPYRHFKTRHEVLVAVAAAGFERLGARMQAALLAAAQQQGRIRPGDAADFTRIACTRAGYRPV